MKTLKNKIEYDTHKIKKITIISIIINLLLSVIKFTVGIIGSSQAVIADAFHSLSDLSTDFIIILGVKYWSAPPDEDHPYGHLRIEALITVIIGLVLAIVAIKLGYNSFSSIREIHTGRVLWIAVIGPAISIIIKEYLYQWTNIIGKRVKSKAVIANAWHHRSDALSSIPAVIAVVVSAINPELAYIDHIGAIIIAIFILKVSWDIIFPSLLELVDRGASHKDNLLIKKNALQVTGVKDVHAIRTRIFGSSLQVDLHILVEPDISVRKGHDISEQVKKQLISKGPNILDVVVHIEPYEGSKDKNNRDNRFN
jgi:cation diffusion facilitator family transporter